MGDQQELQVSKSMDSLQSSQMRVMVQFTNVASRFQEQWYPVMAVWLLVRRQQTPR